MIDFSGIEIKPEEIIFFLKKRMKLKDTCYQLLHQKIINKAIEDNGIVVTSEEIQAEANKLRRQKHLEKASDTFNWLESELISPEDWEAGIHETLASHKLANHLFAKKVEDFFQQNQHNFEKILLYQIIVSSQTLAWEIFYQIEEEEISFYKAAHLYDIDLDRRTQCGYIGKVHRYELKQNIATLVFQATPGTVMTPFLSEQGYQIFLVEEFIPAELTEEIYQILLNQMFQDWLGREIDYMLFNQTEDQKAQYSHSR